MDAQVVYPDLIRHGSRLSGAPTLSFGDRRFTKYAVDDGTRLTESLRHLAFDGPSVQTVERILIAIERDEPLLIEGDPATTKTAGVILAARLIGMPCWRINFSGMTQTDDLLGRYLPTAGAGGQSGAGQLAFEWVDGPAVVAAREGGILLLDEPNLAPSPVLDRLLPLLDTKYGGGTRPELVLQERGREVIAVSPNLRLISVMNSASHVGRRRQSGAFFSRHTPYHTKPPSEADIELMLRHLTTQERLVITHRDQQYVAPGADLVAVSEVGDLPGWREATIPALAKFFVSLGTRCAEGSIGRDRRDPYVFDRRRLYSFVIGVERELREGGSPAAAFKSELERHFLDAVADEDRTLVADLAKSHALWPEASALAGPRARRRSEQETRP